MSKKEMKKKTVTYNMTMEQIKILEERSRKRGAQDAIIAMLAVPGIVIKNHMDRVVNSENPTQKMIDECLEQFDCFVKGYVTLEDMSEFLKEEAGVSLQESAKEFNERRK